MSENRLIDYLIKKGNITTEIVENYITELKNSQVDSSISNISNQLDLDILEQLENVSKRAKTFFDRNMEELKTQVNAISTQENIMSEQNQFSFSNTDPISLKKIFEYRYQILEILGEGGMGVVKRAYDKVLKRDVALKEIKLQQNDILKLSKSQKLKIWRFKREAAITAKLEHPNIVPIYDMQENSNSQIYYTMRKIEGKSLRNLFIENKNSEKMGEYHRNEFVSILLKICDALQYAHSQGVVHRDLKPENIMVGEFGEVYLVDWGIAKEFKTFKEDTIDKKNVDNLNEENLESEYRTMGAIGTFGYMAPEQSNPQEHTNPRMDIYALGKILKECFTLISPIEEMKVQIKENKKRMIFSYMSEAQEKDTVFSLPKDIEAIIKKSTQELPYKRYITIKEMAQDMEKYIKGIPVSVREYTPLEVTFKFVKRNVQEFLIGFAILLLLIRDFIFSNYLQILIVALFFVLELNFRCLPKIYKLISRKFKNIEETNQILFLAFILPISLLFIVFLFANMFFFNDPKDFFIKIGEMLSELIFWSLSPINFFIFLAIIILLKIFINKKRKNS